MRDDVYAVNESIFAVYGQTVPPDRTVLYKLAPVKGRSRSAYESITDRSKGPAVSDTKGRRIYLPNPHSDPISGVHVEV